MNYGRFAYGSFRLRSVRLRLESIRLRLICQFAYVLKHVLHHLIHLLYVRSRSDPSRSIQFLERDPRQVKPKLISYMLMKSLTFFSLGAAHASAVYTKTVKVRVRVTHSIRRRPGSAIIKFLKTFELRCFSALFF